MERNVENSHSMKQIILNTKKPLLIKNQIRCDLTSWSLSDWSEIIGNELLQFRCGKNQYTEEPQWESSCSLKEAKFKDFLENIDSNTDEWWYFDYKHLCQWFTDKEILTRKIDWSGLGFSEIDSSGSTMWIGSKGAHTSCHMDTYGCNIVLQIFGRKQWILFPPEQNLKPTRIPFEESSISHCHQVILNPGEVLVVPNKWWHYVENLETAISVNAWLPLQQDDYQRIKESIATIFVGQMIQNQDKLKDIILNPNMVGEMVSPDVALNIIKASSEKCKGKNKVQKIDKSYMQNRSESLDVEQLLNQFRNISEIPVLSETEFKAFLSTQFERFGNRRQYSSEGENIDSKKIIDFLQVITDDEVLDLIANKIIIKQT